MCKEKLYLIVYRIRYYSQLLLLSTRGCQYRIIRLCLGKKCKEKKNRMTQKIDRGRQMCRPRPIIIIKFRRVPSSSLSNIIEEFHTVCKGQVFFLFLYI